MLEVSASLKRGEGGGSALVCVILVPFKKMTVMNVATIITRPCITCDRVP